MSMDLSVWSEYEIELSSNLPEKENWVVYGSEYAFEQDEWQVLVMLGEGEKPDESIINILPKANLSITYH